MGRHRDANLFAVTLMQDNDSELAQAALLCRQAGYPKAAHILSEAWAHELRKAKHKRGEYKPAYGGAWVRREQEEYE